MSAPGFDIDSLLRFKPSEFLCKKCMALLRGNQVVDWRAEKARCPVCRVSYLPTEHFGFWRIEEYLKAHGLGLQSDDLLKHCQGLAQIARNARLHQTVPDKAHHYPPVRALFEALLNAQQFIHFASYGTSNTLIGALKMTAQRVPVRGFVSNADKYAIEELQTYAYEAPKLDVRLFNREAGPEEWGTTPHQKLIVVDGLIAFGGSANLTTSGWRKAAQGRDSIEVVTDVSKVVEMHNRLFSPVWAKFSDVQQIEMLDPLEDIPF